MSADKKSLVLYHDIRTPLELLSDEERGKLFMAILDYSEFGAQPDFDGALRMAFAFIETAIDRDAEAWEAKREKRREAGSMGGKQRVANQANATFAKQIKQSQANQAANVPANVPANVNVPVIENKADKPPVHPYGQYGWVKLTDEQHAKLLVDLGAEELDRCITLVDESAQANGNRNGWKDWNLVIQKCHRDGWGKGNKHESTSYHSMPTGSSGKRFNIKYDVE